MEPQLRLLIWGQTGQKFTSLGEKCHKNGAVLAHVYLRGCHTLGSRSTQQRTPTLHASNCVDRSRYWKHWSKLKCAHVLISRMSNINQHGGRTKLTDCAFIARQSTLTRDIDIAILSVCLSVRHVPVFYESGLTYCHSFSPHGSPIILVLSASNIFAKFRRGHPHPLWGR